MKKIWNYLSILINYYVEEYTLMAFIILMLLFSLGYTFVFLKMVIPSILFLSLAIFILIIRTAGTDFNDSFYNKWFITKNYCFMIKESDTENNFYDQVVIYRYNYNQHYKNSVKKFYNVDLQTYEHSTTWKFSINFTKARFATKKEIEKHNLKVIEAKMLLLKGS